MPSLSLRLRSTLFACLRGVVGIAILGSLLASRVTATQVVYLNFNFSSGTNEVDFTQESRDGIQAIMEKDYAMFDFEITQTQPTSGEYATLFFNDGPAFGVADEIDFRNLNKSDRARIQTTPAFDPSPENTDDLGEPINPNAFNTIEEFVAFTAFVASHELGHLQGLRHRDSLGQIGSGFSDNPSFLFGGSGRANPFYPGPTIAIDTPNHIMETGISQVEITSLPEKYFGPREAIKLSFNETGVVVPEASGLKQTLATAQPINLEPLSVPVTYEPPPGIKRSFEYFVDAVAVTGRIASPLEKDHYSFTGQAGELINIELLSGVLDMRYQNRFDTRLTLFDSSGDIVDYYGTDAINNDEFESTDSLLLDLYLPEDDTYTIRVDAEPDLFGLAYDTGSYELFIHRFAFEQTDTIFDPDLAIYDLNDDGIVNAADYTAWRDTNGQTVPAGSGADFDGNGKIDELDYEKWNVNYGAAAVVTVTTGPTMPGGGGDPGNSVPEPSALLLVFVALSCAAGGRLR